MRFDRYFAQDAMPTASPAEGTSMPLGSFVVCPVGIVTPGQWAEIYRLAHQRTVEALRPTRYDRAMTASAN
jgi:hypothetical protein